MVESTLSYQPASVTSKNIKVIAAIPCFNTESFIADIVTRTLKYVDEVIVVDDGSSDATAEVAKSAGARVVRHGFNKGYGEALKSCFAAAKADLANILVTIDGDGQHNPDEIPKLLTPVFRKEAELVIGSRFLTNQRDMPRYRKLGIGLITFLWNIGSKIKVSDAQSGFRAYTKQVINNVNISEKGMSVSIEILEKLRRQKPGIKEIPITCSYQNNNSCFTFKSFRHGISVAFSVLRLRLRKTSLKKLEI